MSGVAGAKSERHKTEHRIQKTKDRMGESGNQDNRMKVIRVTGDQGKSPECPDNLII